MPKQLVLMDHDGGVDDYLALLLLLTMDGIDVLGVVVTPADCYIKPAVSATRKILDLSGRHDIPVAESDVRGLNPFPHIFRRDAFAVDHFPILNEREHVQSRLVEQTGQAFMASRLREAPEPVTLLVTGPLTTVAAALDLDPTIEPQIREILWMGGALDVPGNVSKAIEGGQDGSAEWNVYWDPIAAHRIWKTSIPITLCPLDITNKVPITPELAMRLCRQRRYPFSDLAGMCYALVMHQDYFAWDVLTTAYLGKPEIFELREQETEIIAQGASQGRTKVAAGGRRIKALDKVDLEGFYAYILEQWSR